MVIVVFDSFGNCRIGSPIIARSPISRINRLTTSASTGRRIKMSVNDMAQSNFQPDGTLLTQLRVRLGFPSPTLLNPLPPAGGEGRVRGADRTDVIRSKSRLVERRIRRRCRGGVANLDLGAVLDLDLTRRDHPLAGLQPVED